MPLTERDRRTLKMGGIVLGVLLVGFFLFNLLAGGGDELPPIEPIPTDVAVPTDSPSITPTVTPPPIAVFTGRDPFSVPPVLASTSGGSSPTSPTSPTSPGTSPPVSPPVSQPPTQPGDGSGTNQGGDSIVLIDTFTLNGVGRAQVDVNGQVYDVAVGEAFANGRYRLRSVSANCATFVRGDEAFTLCVDENK